MIRKLISILTLAIICCLSCAPKTLKPGITNLTQEFIFDTPPTKSCHASTIVELLPNKLMAAWFGGTYEGAKDVGIYAATFNGTAWSAPQGLVQPLVTGQDTLPCWNPVLFKSKSQTLYLFYKVGKNPREWFGAKITSKDNGKTWSAPQYLPNGILGPIKNKPIEITPGILLCGSSTESVETNQWRVHVEQYNEQSDTWKNIAVDNNNFDTIQPTFIVHKNKTVQMLCRSRHNKVMTSWSTDNGNSWTTMDSLNIPNCNSGIDALTLSPTSFLLVNNPLPQGKEWFNGRNVLDLEYSNDGVVWQKLIDLENQPNGEFSYPAIIKTSNGKIHITYTFDRKMIKHSSFELSTN